MSKKIKRTVWALKRPDGNIQMIRDDMGDDYWFGRTRYATEIQASCEVLGISTKWEELRNKEYSIVKVEIREI